MHFSLRETLIAAAVAGLAGQGTAVAQGVGIDVYAGAPYGYYSGDYYPNRYRYAPPPPPRVLGYTSEYAGPNVMEPAVIVPLRPSNCGEFHYWNGVRCADARVEPPSIR